MGRLSLSKVNVGNLLVLLGVAGLGFSFWLPYGTADRVYRIENRACGVAEEITKVASQMLEIDWTRPDRHEEMRANINKVCGSTDPESSLHLRSATPPRHLDGRCFVFEGKHYFYLVTNTPKKILGIDAKIKKPGEDGPKDKPPAMPTPTVPPLEGPRIPLPEDIKYPFETYAWPRTELTGARTVFFFPSDGRAAFTRNIADRYVGLSRVPRPGDGRMDIESDKRENDYRGHDDERWIYKSRDTTKND